MLPQSFEELVLQGGDIALVVSQPPQAIPLQGEQLILEIVA